MTHGLVIAAPRSGSGKTLVTLGLLAALARRGLERAAAALAKVRDTRRHLKSSVGGR